jgi:nucleoside-diphosphate-sugar epimerase
VLVHHNTSPQLPKRTIVIGAAGFVGAAVTQALRAEGANVVPLARAEIDLMAPDAAKKLAGYLQPGDAVVAVAAKAPCKDMGMLIDNMVMAKAMMDAIAASAPSHVVNISSDAVYPDEPVPLTEAVAAAPSTPHGVMHLAREIGFAATVRAPLANLRPTLIFGAADPHNGYGPNRFRRDANVGKDIVLFGEGEERRDHVSVDDVAAIVLRVLKHRSAGTLNVASGAVHSFRDVAEKAVALSGKAVAIKGSPRNGPMPHKGYRPFDVSATFQAFPDFRYTALADGLAKAQAAGGKV